MKKILFCLGVLVIILPAVIITGNFFGKPLITGNEYFYLVFAFVVSVLLYDKYDKKKTG